MNKHYLAVGWDDLNKLEEEVLSNIEQQDASYYYGMLEVIRWMKDKNVYEPKNIENE